MDLIPYFNTFFFNKITSKTAQKRSETDANVQKPCKVTCVTLRRHVGVLYADGARFTHRFVREERRFGLEIEGIIHI